DRPHVVASPKSPKSPKSLLDFIGLEGALRCEDDFCGSADPRAGPRRSPCQRPNATIERNIAAGLPTVQRRESPAVKPAAIPSRLKPRSPLGVRRGRSKTIDCSSPSKCCGRK